MGATGQAKACKRVVQRTYSRTNSTVRVREETGAPDVQPTDAAPVSTPVSASPTRRLPPFWRSFLLAFVVVSLLGCSVGAIGLAVGMRNGGLLLLTQRVNGVHAPDGYLGQAVAEVGHVVIFLPFTTGPQDGSNRGVL
jgi:hypothetical protein